MHPPPLFRYGGVWLGALDGTPVAVKTLHRSRLDEANLRAFRAECELVRAPNISRTSSNLL